MINFKYHIISLMAVFIALAVGIAVGVSLGTPVEQGVLRQADVDREQVNALRTEIDRRNALDVYRNTYDLRIGEVVVAGQLQDVRVALVTMPGAPGAVTQAVSTAVEQAGGQVVADVKVGDEVFDASKADQVDETFTELNGPLNLNDSMSVATKFGLALGKAVAARGVGPRDVASKRIGATLASAGLANVREDVDETAQLVVVVTAPQAQPALSSTELVAHVQTELALKDQDQAGVVLAGPNSKGLDSTDVLAARTTSRADDELSSVDVADLPSGVVTVVLAGKEQVLGRQGHYGALARTDSALPSLPVR